VRTRGRRRSSRTASLRRSERGPRRSSSPGRGALRAGARRALVAYRQ
jgi:hypothetical protein